MVKVRLILQEINVIQYKNPLESWKHVYLCVCVCVCVCVCKRLVLVPAREIALLFSLDVPMLFLATLISIMQTLTNTQTHTLTATSLFTLQCSSTQQRIITRMISVLAAVPRRS